MVSILKWMGRTFARFVGLAVMILGGWILLVNLVEGPKDAGWVYAWVLGSGALGAAGGLSYLFSFDGPPQFRRRWVRVLSWVGMLFSVLLPTTLTFMLVPLVLLVSPTLFMVPTPVSPAGDPVTSE